MSTATWDFITGTTFADLQGVENAIRASDNMHFGTTAPSYAEKGTIWCKEDGSGDLEGVYVYDGSNWLAIPSGAKISTDYKEYTDDTTPDVALYKSIGLSGTSAYTVTAFDNAADGQVLRVVALDVYATIDGGLTKTGMTIPLIAGDTLEFIYDGTDWQQVAGTVGMGVFVRIDPSNEVGDWIDASDTSWHAVDVSDDGVRKGASVVTCKSKWFDSTAATNLYCRKNGSTEGQGEATHRMRVEASGEGLMFWEVALDNDAKFEASVNTIATVNVFNCYAFGYII